MHTVRVFPLRRTAHAQVTVARRGQRFAKRFRPGIEAVIAKPSSPGVWPPGVKMAGVLVVVGGLLTGRTQLR